MHDEHDLNDDQEIEWIDDEYVHDVDEPRPLAFDDEDAWFVDDDAELVDDESRYDLW